MNTLPVQSVDARDISNAVLFLASDEARYVTGLEFTVDAGNTIRLMAATGVPGNRRHRPGRCGTGSRPAWSAASASSTCAGRGRGRPRPAARRAARARARRTLLRAITAEWGIPLVFVEGNADLTPAKLVGHHNPARVLREDYSADNFVDGPLLEAMRAGGFLYIEEFNRAPEDTLNTLLTAMAERQIAVPRAGTVDGARRRSASSPR